MLTTGSCRGGCCWSAGLCEVQSPLPPWHQLRAEGVFSKSVLLREVTNTLSGVMWHFISQHFSNDLQVNETCNTAFVLVNQTSATQKAKQMRRKRTTVRGKQMEAAQQRGIKEGNAQEAEASGEMDEKRKRRRWMEGGRTNGQRGAWSWVQHSR